MKRQEQFVRKINRRLRETRKAFPNGTDYIDYLIQQAGEIEGVIKTPKGLSIKSVFDTKTMEKIDQLLPTRTNLVEKAKAFIESAYSEEDETPDTENMSSEEIVNAAGEIAIIYATYNDALSDYYNYDKDVTSALDMLEDKVKEDLIALLHKIDKAIHHPGIWALPVGQIEENKALIGEFVAKAKALKEGQ